MKIQQPQVYQNLNYATKYNPSEGIPEVNDKISLSIDLNPIFSSPCTKIGFIDQATTGTLSLIPATSAAIDRYILSISLSLVKDITCDVASGGVKVGGKDIDGVTTTFLALAVLTLTAQENAISITFSNPLKISPTTAVTLSGTFTAGAMSRSASITWLDIEK